MRLVSIMMARSKMDQTIVHKLYEENKQKLYFIAWRILKDEMRAEDAVHNGFLKMVKNFDKYHEQSYTNLVKMSCIIVRNAAIDMIREQEKLCYFSEETGMNEDALADESEDLLDAIIQDFDMEILKQSLSELPSEEKELIYLRYSIGLKPKEIGAIMNMSSAMVRKKLFCCRNKLAESMKQKGYDGLK